MKNDGYILEDRTEFERLERQSTYPAYDYRVELAGFNPGKNARILDAGCGSGVVSRYLAKQFPDSQVVGCDFSAGRLSCAGEAAAGISNLGFETQDLTAIKFPDHSFDAIVCRYVVEHVANGKRETVMSELHRVLKPGGTILVIDGDGILFNIYPQPPFVAEILAALSRSCPVDLMVGRKLNAMMVQAGFTKVSWRAETMQFHGECLDQEIEMTEQRLRNAAPFMISFLGSEAKAMQFTQEYVEALKLPETVLFYNKFLVTGQKAPRHS